MVWKSFVNGARQMWSYRRLLAIFYLVNLLAGLLVAVPARSLLSRVAGRSLMGRVLADQVNMDFVFELFRYHAAGTRLVLGMFLFVTVLYALVQLFFSGGALAVFHSGQSYRSDLFWGSAGAYFGRFVRLALWALPVLAVLFLLQYVEKGLERLIFGSDPYQYITYWGGWIRVGLRYLSFILYLMVLDYARIYAVISGERRMRLAVWRGLKFTFRNLGGTLLLALLLLAVGWLGWLIYGPVAGLLGSSAAAVILFLFLWQQIFMAFRMGLQLTRYSSEMILYKWRTGLL